ncbi:Mss4-like protein [Dipodascopsis uninucleata]
MPYTGECNCGKVKITLKEMPANSIICHCENCKHCGFPFNIFLRVPESDFSVTEGSELLKDYADTKTKSGKPLYRTFCSECGSNLFARSEVLDGHVACCASLYEKIPPATVEYFKAERIEWVDPLVKEA